VDDEVSRASPEAEIECVPLAISSCVDVLIASQADLGRCLIGNPSFSLGRRRRWVWDEDEWLVGASEVVPKYTNGMVK
jgi:hypothetical protein